MFINHSHARRLAAGALVLAGLVVFSPRARAAEPDGGFEVHDVSVWMIDRGGNTANSKSDYPSALPVTVASSRGAQAILQNTVTTGLLVNGGAVTFNTNDVPAAPAAPQASDRRAAPINLITFHGQPTPNIDVDVRTRSGSFLAHWPPGEALPNRLRWSGTPPYDLVAKIGDEAELMFVDSDHWMVKAREAGGLYIKRGARSERFLAYDVELSLDVPLRLEGGPDKYRVINTTEASLYDVLIARITPEGCRVAWIDVVPKSGSAAAAPQPGAENPNGAQPPKAAQYAPGAPVAEPKKVFSTPLGLPTTGAVPAAKPAEAPQPGGSKLFGGLPPTKPAQGVEVVLSEPLAADSPAAAANTTQALADRLAKAGLSPAESALFVERYGSQLFGSKELVVACRLERATIDDKVPLSIFPAPTKTVRVAMVFLRNADPRMGDEVQGLVAQLGDPKWKVREAAHKRLLELGPVAYPALNSALNSPDQEIVLRAERILLKQNQTPKFRAGAINVAPGVFPVPAAAPARILINR
jgi:hypothetical protein